MEGKSNKLSLEKNKEQMESQNVNKLSQIISEKSKLLIDEKQTVEGRELNIKENIEYKRLKKSLKNAIDNDDVSIVSECARKIYHYLKIKKDAVDDEIIKYLNQGFEVVSMSPQQYLYYCKNTIDIFTIYKLYQEVINLMCNCAEVFSDYAAYQSAYRILYDAMNLAEEIEDKELIAFIALRQAIICLREGDIESAENDFLFTIQTMNEIKQEIPDEVWANLALIAHRKGELEKACNIYESLIVNSNEKNELFLASIELNLSLSYFRRGNDYYEKAIYIIKKIVSNKKILELNKELAIEAYLLLAKLFISDSEKSSNYLSEAISLIEVLMNSENKLHYRRGIREIYIDKIYDSFVGLCENIPVENIINILIFLKINSFSEWVSVLNNYKKIENNFIISKELEVDLKRVICNLISAGTPILMGFQEKYDDPFEDYGPILKEMDNSVNKRWIQFDAVIKKIKIEIPSYNIYELSSINCIREYFIEKKNKCCFIFTFLIKGKIICWYNIEGKFLKKEMELANYTQFLIGLHEYKAHKTERNVFVGILDSVESQLCYDFNSIIDTIIENNIENVLIFPDKTLFSIPYIAPFIKNDIIRKLILNSKFEISISPILGIKQNNMSCNKNISFLVRDDSNLPLQEAEMNIIQKFNNFDIQKIPLEELDWESKKFSKTEIFHVSSHGMPISFYTDPYFANLIPHAEHVQFGLPNIQKECWDLTYKVSVINACNSADTLDHNYFNHYKSNEIINYGSTFILNGISDAISTVWPIMDIVAYVFTYYFYEEYMKSTNAVSAHNIALTKMYNLPSSELRKILEQIEDDEVKSKKLKYFKDSEEIFPFRSSFCYCGYIVESLLR